MDMKRMLLINFMIRDWIFVIQLFQQRLGEEAFASALVKAAYDYARANGLKPIATCSYAVVWLQRHPEYQGEVGKDFCGENSCAL